MGNCLVTKYKVEVDNPNLPVLETMQQFTLDAITASGNSLMTEDQQWALNHFFIQIGAINNSGIFSKMDYIFLPCICGRSLAKALVNYKDNTVVISSDSQYQFDGNGIVKGSSVSGNYGTVDINTTYSFDQDDVTLAIGCYAPSSHYGRATSEICRFRDNVDTSVYDRPTIPYKASGDYWYGLKMFGYRFGNNITDYHSVVAVFDATTQKASFFKDELANADGVSEDTAPSLGSSIELKQHFAGVPLGAILYGKALSASERQLLAKAIKELIVDFIYVA